MNVRKLVHPREDCPVLSIKCGRTPVPPEGELILSAGAAARGHEYLGAVVDGAGKSVCATEEQPIFEAAFHLGLQCVINGVSVIGSGEDSAPVGIKANTIHAGIQFVIQVQMLAPGADIGHGGDQVARQGALDVHVPLQCLWVAEVGRHSRDAVKRRKRRRNGWNHGGEVRYPSGGRRSYGANDGATGYVRRGCRVIGENVRK